MELGKGKLLRTGLNALHQAIHPVHGIAWTDGKQVILTSLYQRNGEPNFGNSNVVGQFEHVHGLYWGPFCAPDAPALLAIQHKRHITMWQLCYSGSEQNKLMVYQISEISELFPILPQGCVWHPQKEILAVLTTRETSVLHSVRLNNSRIKADIKGSGIIHCACWTEEGKRLVIGIGSTLHSYMWDDDQKTLNACSFCPIFDVGGYVCAIEPTMSTQVAVATELPLDKICSLNAGVSFEIPSEIIGNPVPSQGSSLENDGDASVDDGEKLTDQESFTSSPVDLTHLPSGKQQSENSPLINLRSKDYLTGSGHDASHFILVTFEKKATTSKKVSIPGILVPDIMAFDSKTQTVVVASNTCNIILTYSLTSTLLPNIQQIHLEKNERPKGLCFLTEKLLLILVGKQKLVDPAFLPSSRSDKYILRLIVRKITSREGHSALSGPTQICFRNIPVKREYVESHSSDAHFLREGLLLPDCVSMPFPGKKKLIEEIANEQCSSTSVDSAEKKMSKGFPQDLRTLDVEPIARSFALQELENSSGPLNMPISTTAGDRSHETSKLYGKQTQNSREVNRNVTQSDKEANCISKNLEELCYSFAELQHQLFEITELLRSGKKIVPQYPPSCEPSFVNVICQKESSGSVTSEQHAVILCDGKLRLSIIQKIFNVGVVEMQHDLSWIVLTSDSEGFIPLTFESQQEIIIRDVNAISNDSSNASCKALVAVNSTEGFRKLSSHSLDFTASSMEVLREESSRCLVDDGHFYEQTNSSS
ncbi:WD repeat and coiled-coil-containing protein-like [Protobothrops mucrosquamatus]|uniref:WD repeat and coiled-coil-containing protein-like n=1 Tax=Protobothrops mucrosquamatus TaxID=103944 RepID=UPI000775BFBA|nr:WD repeat and coiled-coil-containing protein-like [Protobothrops mucrosquamatus]